MQREYYCARCGWTHPVPVVTISAGETLRFQIGEDGRAEEIEQPCPECGGPVDARPLSH